MTSVPENIIFPIVIKEEEKIEKSSFVYSLFKFLLYFILFSVIIFFIIFFIFFIIRNFIKECYVVESFDPKSKNYEFCKEMRKELSKVVHEKFQPHMWRF